MEQVRLGERGVLGAGRTMFEGVEGIVDLKKVDEKTFTNGNIVVTYELAK